MAVSSDIKVVPARRRATLRAPLSPAPLKASGSNEAIVRVGAKEVSLTIEPYSQVYFPKTLAAVENLIELLSYTRDELREQGVTK